MCMKDLKLRPYSAGPLYHHEALNGTGYPQGLTKKDIPYEGQIIRVADEYDAIVSKRQYKSHVGISDTLKILVAETKPSVTPDYSGTLNQLAEETKLGKSNPVIVRTLFKVVIDDIGYEITCTQSYIDDLAQEIKRLKQMEKYKEKMEKAKNEKQKNYYAEGVRVLAKPGETIENVSQIHQEYIEAYNTRKAIIDNLYEEIKIIKKMRV